MSRVGASGCGTGFGRAGCIHYDVCQVSEGRAPQKANRDMNVAVHLRGASCFEKRSVEWALHRHRLEEMALPVRPARRKRGLTESYSATCMSRFWTAEDVPRSEDFTCSKASTGGRSGGNRSARPASSRTGDAERDMHVAKKLPRLLFSLYNRWEIPYNSACVHRELWDPVRTGETKGRSMAWAW